MLLTLHLSKIQSGLYQANVVDGTVEVDVFESADISEAIRGAAATSYGADGFHVWYHHVCAGTCSLEEMGSQSEQLAARLVERCAAFRD